jgi:hypothetical protein
VPRGAAPAKASQGRSPPEIALLNLFAKYPGWSIRNPLRQSENQGGKRAGILKIGDTDPPGARAKLTFLRPTHRPARANSQWTTMRGKRMARSVTRGSRPYEPDGGLSRLEGEYIRRLARK